MRTQPLCRSFLSAPALALAGSAFLLSTAPSLAAQQDYEPKLSSSQLKNLAKRAADWVEWEMRMDQASARERVASRKRLIKAREKFVSDLEKRSKDFEVLASHGDLLAIFQAAFPYDSEKGFGRAKMMEPDPSITYTLDHALRVPRSYDSDVPMPLVISLPGRVDGEWGDPVDHLEALWETVPFAEEALVAVPELSNDLEFQAPIDPEAANARQLRNSRFVAVYGPIRSIREEYRIDYDRLIVDFGREHSDFGLRFATYFPQLLGGIILRDLQALDPELRYGSLNGMDVLLIANDQNRSVCEELKKTLDENVEGSCTILEGEGEYPYAASGAAIGEWASQVHRDLLPKKVVVEPNNPYFTNAYWVKLGDPEPIIGVPMELRPRVVVEADRENNRIKIEARGVTDVTLLLNDVLVDLSKPVTIELNGKATTQQFERDLAFMVESMKERRDPSWLFTRQYTTPVTADDESK